MTEKMILQAIINTFNQMQRTSGVEECTSIVKDYLVWIQASDDLENNKIDCEEYERRVGQWTINFTH